jgi:hypothetical protein
VKVLAAGVSSKERIFRLCSKLWLYLDIVPFKLEWHPLANDAQQQAYRNAMKVDGYFNSQSRSQQPQAVLRGTKWCFLIASIRSSAPPPTFAVSHRWATSTK